MTAFLSICLGIGLSIACSFRIFLPMLILSICSKLGIITLNDGFLWLSSGYTITALSIATIIEICAYYIPALDNILDYFSLPVAICAGILVSVSCMKIENPLFLWGLSVIGGAFIVCLIKSMVAVLRGISTTVYVGITNSLLSTVENIISAILGVMSIFLSFSIVFVCIAAIYFICCHATKVKEKLCERKKINKETQLKEIEIDF